MFCLLVLCQWVGSIALYATLASRDVVRLRQKYHFCSLCLWASRGQVIWEFVLIQFDFPKLLKWVWVGVKMSGLLHDSRSSILFGGCRRVIWVRVSSFKRKWSCCTCGCWRCGSRSCCANLTIQWTHWCFWKPAPSWHWTLAFSTNEGDLFF